MRAIAVGVMAGMAAMTLADGAVAESPLALVVRLYNTSGIPAPELTGARHAAESILRDAGLSVTFRHCGRPASSDDPAHPCDTPLQPSEVVVRVINAPAFNTSLDPDAYGVTYVVKDTNRGWLATVFSDRIEHAATRVGVDPGTLLGRVMAHELGHLLLGRGYHGDAGVMRAEWTDDLLIRSSEEWRFSRIEAIRIHDVLVSIAHGAIANPPAL
jgi:hypothetical protein